MLTLISPKARNFIEREPTLQNVTKLVGYSNSHTLAITTDGKLYSVGQNANGQLGVGDLVDRDEYQLVVASGVVDIDAFLGISSYTLSNKNLFMMG